MNLFNVLLKKELVTQLFGESRGKRKDILGNVVSVLISLVFLALFVYLFVAFQSKFAALNLVSEVLVLFAAAAIIAQIAMSVARASKVLYGGADAKVILPLPISNLTMLTAKLSALWVKEVVNSCFFLAPVLLAYGIMNSANVGYYICAALSVAVASLFIVSIAAIIAPLFIKVKRFFVKNPLALLILVLVAFGALFIVYSRLLAVVSDMLLGNRLHFIFNKTVADTLRQISGFAFFAKQIGDFLQGDFVGFIIILFTAGAVAVGAYFISSHFYLAYLKANTARRSSVNKEEKNVMQGVTGSLIVKELIEIFRNPAYLVSYLSVALTLPVLCYLTLGALDELVDKLLGSEFFIPFALLILVMFSCVCNTFAGDVISREENRIMIVKTIPVSYKKQVGVKVGIALTIAGVADIITVLNLGLTGSLGALPCVMLLFITMFATFSSIMNLVARDIDNPSVNSSGGENQNVSFAVVRSLLFSCVLGGICFVLYGVFALYTGGNAFLKAIASFTSSIGGIYGVLTIALVVCLADMLISAFKLFRNLETRMRRIKI